MKDLFETYYLYCTNFSCNVSIYKNIREVSLPLTGANLSTTHFCSCCHKPLVSAIDMEIEQIISSVGVKPAARPVYNTNY
jgi:hypothetical protein